MSKDIRSFFQVTKPKKVIDDDVIPESPDVEIKKVKKNRNKRIIIDDSDEEIFTPKKQKQTNATKSPNKKKNKTPDKPALKEVKVVDLFGKAPIKRTDPLVQKVKKKTETGIHSDEEFEKSLLEVDAFEELAVKEITKDKSPIKIDETDKLVNCDIKQETSPIKINGDDKHVKDPKTRALEMKKDKAHKLHSDTSEISLKAEKRAVVSNVFANKKEKKTNTDKNLITDKDSKKDIKEVKGLNEHKLNKRKLSTTTEANSGNENGEGTSRKDKKRDFSEFVHDSSVVEVSDDDVPKSKKKKLDKTLNESILTDEEKHERKQYSAALYQKYLNRSGPKHHGAKQIPEGAPDCLQNCAFLLTGVLDSFERDEVAGAIAKYGGSVKNSMSKKVTHVIAGEDAGPAKMAKAEELGIKIIGEDEFLELIINLSNKKGLNKIPPTKEMKKEKSPARKSHKSRESSTHESYRSKETKEKCDEINESIKNHVPKAKKENHTDVKSKSRSTSINNETKTKDPQVADVVKPVISSEDERKHVGIPNAIMWVDKYKPQNVKQIIGQHGDASNVKKLINWLTKWYLNRKAKLPKPSPWAKNDDGGYYKAALLSGPPGVGKTTTVSLVCKELGFDVVEFNASDTRNKALIKEQIGELLTTTSLASYAKGDRGKQAVTKKHVLVMDEVDGMAGNEDRGGLQELIGLIKATSVPIICMCNDRNSQKMRSLVNYCYDLRFSRPRVEQIKSAMMSICCKEGIKIPPDALTQLIIAANQDVRQTLNLLSMWAVDANLADSERLKRDAKSGKKDIKLGPWEAIRKVFSAEDHKTMTINDKSDLFFYDYSLAPLFVQENYLQVSPHCPKHELLERISKAADSISLGDLVDKRIRSSQAWNLLPVQAMYSSVIPGSVLSGHVAGQIQFPGWLGKNSRAGKMHRLCQEIHAHTRLSTSGSKSSIFLDYCKHLRDAVVTPMIKDKGDGVAKALEVLESYHLLREDLDSLTELSQWPGQRDPMILIDAKIKASMTRAYNKKALALPYAPGSVKKGRAKADDGEEGEGQGEGEEEEDEHEDSDPENDALIKKKKVEKQKKEKPVSSKDKPGHSKEKPGSSKDKPNSTKKKK